MSIFAFSSVSDNGARPRIFASLGLGKFHQLLDKSLLVRCRRDIVQYLVLVRSINTYILCRPIIGNLVIESGQLRHFDKVAETLLCDNAIRNIELKIGGLLCEDSRPCVKASDLLPFKAPSGEDT